MSIRPFNVFACVLLFGATGAGSSSPKPSRPGSKVCVFLHVPGYAVDACQSQRGRDGMAVHPPGKPFRVTSVRVARSLCEMRCRSRHMRVDSGSHAYAIDSA